MAWRISPSSHRRPSQEPRQMHQKIMYQNGRTLEFVGSSSHGAGARFAGRAEGNLIRLFVCVFFFFFFFFPFLRSYYGVADEHKWHSVQVQFTEPSAGVASPSILDAVLEQQWTQPLDQLPGRKRMRVIDATRRPTYITILGPIMLSRQTRQSSSCSFATKRSHRHRHLGI